MKFFTETTIVQPDRKLSYENKILILGSCFADEIGTRMLDRGMNTLINPFGTLYNPFSIASSMERLADCRYFVEEDLMENDGIYSTFHHHGKFSDCDPDRFLKNANDTLKKSSEFFNAADTVIITLGSAFVYRHIARNIIVANCHKADKKEFERRRMSISETAAVLKKMTENNRDKNFLFTVSPIRHLRDGAHENNLSKATLMIAIDEIISNKINEDNALKNSTEMQTISYFPSYEIIMDELRDYRFYASDMVHLSDTAIDYVFEKFRENYIDSKAYPVMDKAYAIVKGFRHKALFPESETWKEFRNRLESEAEKFKKKYPGVSLPPDCI